ncbi:MAG TPA: formylmethanofuran dehydrogenase subunit E family protein [Atribacterota bacterium]|nr:formylmethanofuran dehydrogenase subunit E family protein [Atribacterota bacterium]HPK87471.1 formylmethanofuran dehydrogenase subunit E family protein [Atribacterota bacterium]
MIKLTVERDNIKDMVERGIKLHGHSGPYLNLGIRMGLLALDQLDAKGYFGLSTEVELEYRTPMSCLIDGLQISTGCTMGKGNIKVKNNPVPIKVTIKSEQKTITVTIKPEIYQLMDFKKNTDENLAEKILKMGDRELFDYSVTNETP